MNIGRGSLVTMAITLALWGWQYTPARCQEAPSRGSTAGATDSQDAARRQIIESDRWRRAEQHLNEWLSVQTIYTPDEVTAIRAEMKGRVAQMSPRELESFMKEMEDRLAVLTSPEAADARQWLAQFMAVAKNPEEQLGISRPDVMNMTASEVRHELQRLQQVRDSRLQAQSSFNQTRGIQAQAALDAQAARRAALEPPTNRSSWPANTPQPRNQNRWERTTMPFRPMTYGVTPWGTPIIWH